jgi:hypothetical protein
VVSKYRLITQDVVGRIQGASRRLGTADAAKAQMKRKIKWQPYARLAAKHRESTQKGPEWKTAGDYHLHMLTAHLTSPHLRPDLSLKSFARLDATVFSLPQGNVGLRSAAVISNEVDRQQGSANRAARLHSRACPAP